MINHMGEGEMRKVKSILRENAKDIIPVSLDEVQPRIKPDIIKNANP
jgi:hypothetical protein